MSPSNSHIHTFFFFCLSSSISKFFTHAKEIRNHSMKVEIRFVFFLAFSLLHPPATCLNRLQENQITKKADPQALETFLI